MALGCVEGKDKYRLAAMLAGRLTNYLLRSWTHLHLPATSQHRWRRLMEIGEPWTGGLNRNNHELQPGFRWCGGYNLQDWQIFSPYRNHWNESQWERYAVLAPTTIFISSIAPLDFTFISSFCRTFQWRQNSLGNRIAGAEASFTSSSGNCQAD